jgi:hypothetical protein
VISPSAAISWKLLRLRFTSASVSSHVFASRSGSSRMPHRSYFNTRSSLVCSCSGFMAISETTSHTMASSSSARGRACQKCNHAARTGILEGALALSLS